MLTNLKCQEIKAMLVQWICLARNIATKNSENDKFAVCQSIAYIKLSSYTLADSILCLDC